ncbi:MAG: riboflavin biosynthesis protein RibF [bacterium]
MRTLQSLSELSGITEPIALAAGVFDGVHVGHRAVVTLAREKAAIFQGRVWVLTFEPHPLRILKPKAAPALLTSTPHKLALLASLGVHGCILLPFGHDFARIEPEAFIDDLCAAAPSLRDMVVGENWTFGHRARGNTSLLRSIADRKSLSVSVVPGMTWNGAVVSSTRIRKAVAAGHLEDAAAMLGRPFSMLGTVVHGRKVGRRLGFPTANVNPHNEVRPPPGIYAVRVVVDAASLPGAAYVSGEASAVEQDIVEVHIIDRHLDLYGHDIEVCFHSKLRDDRRFGGQDELKAQIARDVDQARLTLRSAT